MDKGVEGLDGMGMVRGLRSVWRTEWGWKLHLKGNIRERQQGDLLLSTEMGRTGLLEVSPRDMHPTAELAGPRWVRGIVVGSIK